MSDTLFTFFVGAGILYLRAWEAFIRPAVGFFAIVGCVVLAAWLLPFTLPYALGSAHFGRDPLPLWFQHMNLFFYPDERFRPVLPPPNQEQLCPPSEPFSS